MFEPTLTLVCSDSPIDATTARTSTPSLPLRIEDVNDCTPVINGVALPNAHTLTALTGAGGILTRESAAQRSELLIGFPENEPPNTTVTRIDAMQVQYRFLKWIIT